MDNTEFEQLVAQGIAKIPERFRAKINNVAFLISDEPTGAQLADNDIPAGDTLLGLYEGIPLTERGESYGLGVIVPDIITIFKLPILDEADGNMEEVRDIVYDTVWHEVAHYFGYDDAEILKREMSGTNHTDA